ncbi:MAG: hypothetical protein DME42_01630 [Verrucomicrobia bacterium]|nr:MAG: hypothetical protein DME42_01630 [Verrucomicrobiota bacterium]
MRARLIRRARYFKHGVTDFRPSFEPFGWIGRSVKSTLCVALKSVAIGMVTGVAADTTQTIATAAFGIRPIKAAERHLYQKWNGRKRA